MQHKKILYTIVCSFTALLLHAKLLAQQSANFPLGITIDPGIETICKAQKHLNSFTVKSYHDDVLDKTSIFNAIDWPLTSLVTINKTDTLIIFINMLVPIGFQLVFKNDSCHVETFVYNRSCKCFKNKLTDTALSYGAGAKPDTLTLVLSKRYDLKKGDIIYGYIKTRGGEIYHFPRENINNYDRQKMEYEGYFKVEFKPMQ